MHPSAQDLALYAGGELGWWRRLRVQRHLNGCAGCRRQVEEFQAWRQWLREQPPELPGGVNWSRLAAEMKANIRVGLEAGRCVDGVGRLDHGWRPAALALPVLLVVLAGWLLQVWHPPLRHGGRQGTVLAATAAGLELRRERSTFSLLRPGTATATPLAGGYGVRLRYVDSETGLVTITHVYAE